MASIRIEANEPGDAQLPGGRHTVHRLTIVLDEADGEKLGKRERVPVNVALPDVTVKHLFIGVERSPLV